MVKTTSYLKTKWWHFKDKYANRYIPKIKFIRSSEATNNVDAANDAIFKLLRAEGPCMISRFGTTEYECICNYSKSIHPFWLFRTFFPFWIPPHVTENMVNCSGFFPNRNYHYSLFSDIYRNSARETDILGYWNAYDYFFENECHYTKYYIDDLYPFFATHPWTSALKGKRVLVVHPFKDTILEQYKKRNQLFDNPEMLPEFESLRVVKAVQSLGGENNGFATWFDALKYMEDEIDREDYDVAILGCGAYGMPLAAHCKRMGKKAVHIGGATQLLFGIAGDRWLNHFGEDYHRLCSHANWVRPSSSDRPKNADKVENACYW